MAQAKVEVVITRATGDRETYAIATTASLVGARKVKDKLAKVRVTKADKAA